MSILNGHFWKWLKREPEEQDRLWNDCDRAQALCGPIYLLGLLGLVGRLFLASHFFRIWFGEGGVRLVARSHKKKYDQHQHDCFDGEK